MWALLCLSAVSYAPQGWTGGVGGTLASGNARAFSVAGFVDGAGAGKHAVDLGLGARFGAAVADANGTGTVHDDAKLLVENDRAVGFDVGYGYMLGGRSERVVASALEHRPKSGIVLRPSVFTGVRVDVAKRDTVRSAFTLEAVYATEIYPSVGPTTPG